MKYILIFCFALVLAGHPASAFQAAEPTAEQKARCTAQEDQGAQNFCLSGYKVAPLRLPTSASTYGGFSGTGSMAIYKPEGTGPFPAVILLHTCGAISADQTRFWVKAAIENGYVAFILDSWGQRNLPKGSCDVNPGFNSITVRIRDAYDALDKLVELKLAEPDRVSAIGFSHGGRIAYTLASPGIGKQFSSSGRQFAAAVAVYGECYNRPSKFSYLRPKTSIPLLALLGDKDGDGDITECEPRLQALKAAGEPVEWHVFPGVGHAWDQPEFSSATMRPYAGSTTGQVLYKYDSHATQESAERAFAFLNPLLKK